MEDGPLRVNFVYLESMSLNPVVPRSDLIRGLCVAICGLDALDVEARIANGPAMRSQSVRGRLCPPCGQGEIPPSGVTRPVRRGYDHAWPFQSDSEAQACPLRAMSPRSAPPPWCPACSVSCAMPASLP